MAPRPPRQTAQDVANRLLDDELGIRGGVLMPGAEEPIPDIADLGLSTSVRKQFEALISHGENEAQEVLRLLAEAGLGHVQAGLIARVSSKAKDALTDDLKAMVGEHMGIDRTSFFCRAMRVSYYPQQGRSSLDKDVLKSELMSRGVKPGIIDAAFKAATKVGQPSWALRVTPPGEEPSDAR